MVLFARPWWVHYLLSLSLGVVCCCCCCCLVIAVWCNCVSRDVRITGGNLPLYVYPHNSSSAAINRRPSEQTIFKRSRVLRVLSSMTETCRCFARLFLRPQLDVCGVLLIQSRGTTLMYPGCKFLYRRKRGEKKKPNLIPFCLFNGCWGISWTSTKETRAREDDGETV